MLTVYGWDEICDEVAKQDLPANEDSAPEEVIDLWRKTIADDYDGSSETWTFVKLYNLTLIIGRYGHHKQFMMWWGQDAERFANMVEW